jgi:hypothetical protein
VGSAAGAPVGKAGDGEAEVPSAASKASIWAPDGTSEMGSGAGGGGGKGRALAGAALVIRALRAL